MTDFLATNPLANQFMELRIFLDTNDEETINKYNSAVDAHNEKVFNNTFFDAGFDLFAPNIECFLPDKPFANKIDYQIKTAGYMCCGDYEPYPTGFFIYPRSSISNTHLMLANSIGVIDSTYRGNLMAKFKLLGDFHKVEKHDRLVQIVAPNMCRIKAVIVNSVEELSPTTERGEGGFGSTGR